VVAEGFPQVAGDVPFQGAEGFSSGFPVLAAPVEVLGGGGMMRSLGDRDGVDGPVDLPVPSPVEPVTLLPA